MHRVDLFLLCSIGKEEVTLRRIFSSFFLRTLVIMVVLNFRAFVALGKFCFFTIPHSPYLDIHSPILLKFAATLHLKYRMRYYQT